MAKSESKNSAVVEGGILVSHKNCVKKVGGILGVVPLPNQPNLFLILRLIDVLSQTIHIYIFFIIFIDELTCI